MTRGCIYAIIATFMITQLVYSQRIYNVEVKPGSKERQAIPIEIGPCDAHLFIRPENPWSLGGSDITLQDENLWQAGSKIPSCHTYYLVNAYSSREYVQIDGNFKKNQSGGSGGRIPVFRVTVPGVDIDWFGYEEKTDEGMGVLRNDPQQGEVEYYESVYCPITVEHNDMKRFVVRAPNDDYSMFSSSEITLTLLFDANDVKVYDSNNNQVLNGTGITFRKGDEDKVFHVSPESNQAAQDFFITLEGPASPDGGKPKDKIRGYAAVIDLDAIRVINNQANGELPDTEEETVGAFVPLNKDDDNYDGTADSSSSGSITGESDLLPIKIHKVVPVIALAKYTLTIPSSVKIWQNNDRSSEVLSTTEFDANQDKTLYVEGRSAGSGEIKINLKLGGSLKEDCDRIKVTVFDWIGPHNVPDYSIHQYVASGALSSSKWIAPSGGSIKTGSGSSDVTILWGAGPVIGKAIYEVNSNYKWDLEINVVEVKIEAPDSGDAFSTGNPTYAGVRYIWDETKAVCFSSGTIQHEGLEWKAKVTLNGPSLNSADQRGVTHLEVGFVQNLTFSSCKGNYTVNGNASSLTANIQSNTYLDQHTGVPAGTVYLSLDNTAILKPATVNDRVKTIEAIDTPTSCAPLFYKKGVTLNNPDDDTMDSIQWTDTFKLWLTARTDDTAHNADNVYTCRAIASWSYVNDESYPAPNPLIGTTVNAPSAWTGVVDGSQPNVKDGPTANEILDDYFSY